MKTIILFIVVIFIIALNPTFSQTVDQIVCETVTATGPGAPIWGKYKPAQTASGEYFRVLIVYAQFASDTQTDSAWQLNQLPNWANSIVATNVSSSYSEQTLSDYFDKASLGKFDFIGDIYQNLVIIPTDMAYWNANQYVIGQLNNNITDFTRYDNWKYQNGSFIFSEGNGDDYLDMLIIIYRKADSYLQLGGGIAHLGISPEYITHDGIKINGGTSTVGSGITTKVGLSGKFAIVGHLAHEFGHYLLGEGHTAVGGMMPGYPYEYYGVTYAMDSWEREKLGYISLSNAGDGSTYTLKDFVTYGDAIKIQISSNEYLLVENHQRQNLYDQIIRGGSINGLWDLNTQVGKGIYVYYINNYTT